MPVLSYSQIAKDLQARKFAPVYLLTGEEAYYIDKVSDYIEDHVLKPEEKAFNQVILYGRDVGFKDVIDQVRQFPMMSEYRVVILKEAQQMRELNELKPYFNNPAESSILVISYKHKKFSKASALYKSIAKSGVVLHSDKLYDNQIPDWIRKHLADEQIGINEEARLLLSEYVGADLSKLSNELDKLTINLQKGQTVTKEEIEKYIGISKDYNVFELQRALAHRDAMKIARMVHYFKDNTKENPVVMMVGALYRYFTKVLIARTYADWSDKQLLSVLKLPSPYFLREYRAAARNYSRDKIHRVFQYLLEADKMAKGIDAPHMSEGEIIRELIFKISYL